MSDTSIPGSVLGDSIGSLLTIEQRSGLFKCEVLGLNNEEVAENELEGEPYTVDNLNNMLKAALGRGGKSDARSTSSRSLSWPRG